MRLALADDAVVLGTERGLVIADDLGTQALGGRELGRFAAGLLPLLDGTRSRQEVALALGPDLTEQVSQFIDLLDRRGLLEADPDDRSAPQAEPASALATVGTPPSTAHVTVYVGAPWGLEAAGRLAELGVRKITLVNPKGRGGPGGVAAAITDSPAGEAPWCDIDTVPVHDLGRHLTGVPAQDRLLLVALRSSEVRRHLDVARVAHETGTPQLYGTMKGLSGIVGPFVVPGASACWNCWRLRETACSAAPWAEQLVQATRASAAPKRRDRAPALPDTMSSALGCHLALAARRFLSTPTAGAAGRLQVHNFATGRATEHRVVRMPRCAVCGTTPTDRAERAGPGAASRTTTARELREYLVDPRVGIVRSAGTERNGICPTLITAHATISTYTEDSDLRNVRPGSPRVFDSCWGRAFTEEDALMSALGEAVERYCVAVPPRDIRIGPAAWLDGDVIDPRSLHLYSPEQYDRPGFPFRPYEPDASYQWVPGRWSDGTGSVWLPAELVYYLPHSDRLAQGTTNGLAAGRGREDAAFRATLEVVERDALLRMWSTRTTPPRISPDHVGESCPATGQIGGLTRDLETNGLTVEFYLLPAAGDVPVVLCLGLGDGVLWPSVTVTTAAHPSARTALEKALLEQAQTALSLRAALSSGCSMPSCDSEVRTFRDHALRYAAPAARHRFSFITRATDVVRLGDLPVPPVTERTVQHLSRRMGMPVAIADITSNDLAPTGIRVVRALVPGLRPLYCGAGLERFGSGGAGMHRAPHPMC
ncbi:TOMM precursor leader peptide-binding protein [Kitasatospora sp. NPDC054795]